MPCYLWKKQIATQDRKENQIWNEAESQKEQVKSSSMFYKMEGEKRVKGQIISGERRVAVAEAMCS